MMSVRILSAGGGLLLQRVNTILNAFEARSMLSKLLCENRDTLPERPELPPPGDPLNESWNEVMRALEEPPDLHRCGILASAACIENNILLEDLPEELLLAIITYCDEKKSYHRRASAKTLQALCLTNRLLNRLATPLLYSEYTSSRFHFEFIRTLITRPDLADRLRTLHWTLGHRDPAPRPYSNEVASKLEDHGAFFAVEAAIAVRGGWQRRPGEVGDAYLTAALMIATNIERLSILDEYPDRSISRRWLQPIKLRTPHLFQKLNAIHIDSSGVRLEEISDLFRLPSLKSLRVAGLHDSLEMGWECPPHTSAIEDLVLSACFLHGVNIAEMIYSCKALKQFSYEHVNLGHDISDDEAHFPRLRFSHVKTALNSHAASLQDIDVQVQVSGGEAQHWSSYGKTDSFAHYEMLTDLRLPTHILIPIEPDRLVDQLPPSLEYLYLHDCSFEQFGLGGMRAIESLLRYSENILVRLKTICVGREVTGFLTFDAFGAYESRFAEAGVALRTTIPGSDTILDEEWLHLNDG